MDHADAADSHRGNVLNDLRQLCVVTETDVKDERVDGRAQPIHGGHGADDGDAQALRDGFFHQGGDTERPHREQERNRPVDPRRLVEQRERRPRIESVVARDQPDLRAVDTPRGVDGIEQDRRAKLELVRVHGDTAGEWRYLRNHDLSRLRTYDECRGEDCCQVSKKRER